MPTRARITSVSTSPAQAPTIAPTSALPTITGPVILDGGTQPGFAGQPLIELNGTNAGGPSGLTLTGGSSTIRNLVINRFDRSGISIQSSNNAIERCRIGTNVGGTAALANGRDGITIRSTATGNRIGGTAATQPNLISGNTRFGVYITGSGATGNTVKGNYIGADVNGTSAQPNVVGVAITAGASNNIVGGRAAGAGNLISGNSADGVLITGANTIGNLIKGNSIGLTADLTAALPNLDGIYIGAWAHNNAVGGATAPEANLISGNTNDGVHLEGANTTANTVQGNNIGLNGALTGAVANSDGVAVDNGALANTITSNTIAGNSEAGARVSGVASDGCGREHVGVLPQCPGPPGK